MGKDQRFPSPANVKIEKSGAAPKVPPKQEEPKPVQASRVKTVEVHYSGNRHLVLPNGVHHLAHGLNHVPESVMKDALDHPSVAAEIKAGKIKCPALFKDEAPASQGPDPDQSPDEGDEDGE